jgi:hypothetical protein
LASAKAADASAADIAAAAAAAAVTTAVAVAVAVAMTTPARAALGDMVVWDDVEERLPGEVGKCEGMARAGRVGSIAISLRALWRIWNSLMCFFGPCMRRSGTNVIHGGMRGSVCA